MNVKEPGNRLMRWRIKLEEYNYEIKYRSGNTNTNADALSRIYRLKTTLTSTNIFENEQKFNIGTMYIARCKNEQWLGPRND